MTTERFLVTLNVFIDASDEDEAALTIERALAGKFDSEVISASAVQSATEIRGAKPTSHIFWI